MPSQFTVEDFEGDLIQPGHPLFGIVWINKQRMSGTPCFSGTRADQNPFRLRRGWQKTAGGFLEDFEGVTREQAKARARQRNAAAISSNA